MLQSLFEIYVPPLLGVVLIPDCILPIIFPMFSACRPPASLLSDMCSCKIENCLVGSLVGGSLSFLVFSSASLCFDSELDVEVLYNTRTARFVSFARVPIRLESTIGISQLPRHEPKLSP